MQVISKKEIKIKIPVLRLIPFPIISVLETIYTFTKMLELLEDFILKISEHPIIIIPCGFTFDGVGTPKISKKGE